MIITGRDLIGQKFKTMDQSESFILKKVIHLENAFRRIYFSFGFFIGIF